MTAFLYPAEPHARRHGPQGYADVESYRPWLRDEFAFRCVYCLFREQWGRLKAAFTLDHFVPVSILELYRRGTLSSGKAAELLEMSRWQFVGYASRLGIAFFDMTDAEWQAERLRAQAL